MIDELSVPIDADGKITDFLENKPLEPKPEEFVRQKYLRILHFEYGYPKNLMRREVPVFHGQSEVKDAKGNPIRADIVVYLTKTAAANRNQGQIRFVVECKAPTQDDGYSQLVSYIFNTSAEGGVWFNGSGEATEVQYYRRVSTPNSQLVPWVGIPRPDETWDALGRRKKEELQRPKDIKGLLRRCHNKLHGRGAGTDEEDLTMEMVRTILAKAMDEELPNDLPEFYCTPEEYGSVEGQEAAATRVQNLFNQVKKLNSSVFAEHERINLMPRAICDVIIELQNYKLLSDLYQSQDWDIMGAAYEQYTESSLRRVQGQFFTNRLIVNFMAAVLDPDSNDLVLDPAGGSGGFLTGVMRYVRNKIITGKGGEIAKQRQLDRHRTRLFMVEQSKRLVKVAKTAMILNGDGHAGLTAGDSLGEYKSFDSTIVAQCPRGTPTKVLTNPPFAGVGEGRVSDEATLTRFECGKRWEERQNGKFEVTQELIGGGVPPEMLFLERCIDWLAPGGTLAIVMPKGFLDTTNYRPARTILFNNCQVLGIVNCHKDTFQPHTGVRTCLLFARKFEKNEKRPKDYNIFMAVSRKIGQDSEGVPIYKKDDLGKPTNQLDHDLDDLLKAYQTFRGGKLKTSQYAFSIKFSELDARLRINPQLFLPHLNETLQQIEKLDGIDGWSVSSLGQLSPDIQIFKGPRFKSSDLVVESKTSEKIEPYYTPSAVLQEKGESLKWLNPSRASKHQAAAIKEIRVKEGDILVTRSGSNGRVVYVGKHLNK